LFGRFAYLFETKNYPFCRKMSTGSFRPLYTHVSSSARHTAMALRRTMLIVEGFMALSVSHRASGTFFGKLHNIDGPSRRVSQSLQIVMLDIVSGEQKHRTT